MRRGKDRGPPSATLLPASPPGRAQGPGALRAGRRRAGGARLCRREGRRGVRRHACLNHEHRQPGGGAAAVAGRGGRGALGHVVRRGHRARGLGARRKPSASLLSRGETVGGKEAPGARVPAAAIALPRRHLFPRGAGGPLALLLRHVAGQHAGETVGEKKGPWGVLTQPQSTNIAASAAGSSPCVPAGGASIGPHPRVAGH